MMAYTLTTKQKEEIQGVYYAPYEFFNCVQDINDVWFLFVSQQDKETILGTEWAYLLTLPEEEYVPPIVPFP